MRAFVASSRAFAAALLLLGASQPREEAVLLSLSGFERWSGAGLLLANAEGDSHGGEEDQVNNGQQPPSESSGDSKASEADGEPAAGGKRAGALRGGPAAKKPNAPKPISQKEIGSVFESLLQSLGRDGDGTLMEYSKEAQRLNNLLDSMFPPRLQSAPKYNGALECVNEELYRDVLSGPGNKRREAALLQQAYNFLRSPPMMLVVPALFIELREAADRRAWEEEREAAKRYYEEQGETVPARYLLTAEEVAAEALEEGKVLEDEISEAELRGRLEVINGWLKQQFRLRLYHKKRTGLLKGNPQDYLSSFDAGEDLVAVSHEDMQGLSYEAQLDPAPGVEE
ncbi:hypothetical protein Efla_005122 [Eimeria flavescens]